MAGSAIGAPRQRVSKPLGAEAASITSYTAHGPMPRQPKQTMRPSADAEMGWARTSCAGERGRPCPPIGTGLTVRDGSARLDAIRGGPAAPLVVGVPSGGRSDGAAMPTLLPSKGETGESLGSAGCS